MQRMLCRGALCGRSRDAVSESSPVGSPKPAFMDNGEDARDHKEQVLNEREIRLREAEDTYLHQLREARIQYFKAIVVIPMCLPKPHVNFLIGPQGGYGQTTTVGDIY